MFIYSQLNTPIDHWESTYYPNCSITRDPVKDISKINLNPSLQAPLVLQIFVSLDTALFHHKLHKFKKVLFVHIDFVMRIKRDHLSARTAP